MNDPKLKLKVLLEEEGYESWYSCSTVKKGYSGTAIFVKRHKSVKMNIGSDKEKDGEEKRRRKKKKQATLGSFFNTPISMKAEDNNELSTSIDVKYLLPTNISKKLSPDTEKHNGEGRIITMDFPLFSLINVYVPNSGQKLERLLYRTEEWDIDLLRFANFKREQGLENDNDKKKKRPVIWLGDLNVAHRKLDVWNDGKY